MKLAHPALQPGLQHGCPVPCPSAWTSSGICIHSDALSSPVFLHVSAQCNICRSMPAEEKDHLRRKLLDLIAEQDSQVGCKASDDGAYMSEATAPPGMHATLWCCHHACYQRHASAGATDCAAVGAHIRQSRTPGLSFRLAIAIWYACRNTNQHAACTVILLTPPCIASGVFDVVRHEQRQWYSLTVARQVTCSGGWMAMVRLQHAACTSCCTMC